MIYGAGKTRYEQIRKKGVDGTRDLHSARVNKALHLASSNVRAYCGRYFFYTFRLF